MKLFAMLMLRFALVMLLYSLFQNVTLATQQQLNEWEEWKKTSASLVKDISEAQVPISLENCSVKSSIPQIKKTFGAMGSKLNELSKLSLNGMELLKCRLEEPLRIVLLNCKFLSSQNDYKDNKYFLESLLSKIRSIAKEFEKEYNTFIFEVELELTNQAKWVLGFNEYGNKFHEHWKTSAAETKECYCDIDSFKNAWASTNGNFEHLEALIIDAKLRILETELHAKIADFAQQPPFDWNGFFAFSHNFCLQWYVIQKNIKALKTLDQKKDSETLDVLVKEYTEKLNDLAKNAMNETAPLKAIITKKLDQLVPKWRKEKSVINKIRKHLPSKDKHPTIDGIIRELGIFAGNAYGLLAYFERDNKKNDFSVAELEKDVEKDKEKILEAYEVNTFKFTSEDLRLMN